MTVPPCAPGWNVQSARLSERPARHDNAMTQRPSSPFQESHSADGYSCPRRPNVCATTSPSMRPSGPSARIGWARWATSAVRDRSSNTGYANRSIFCGGTPAAAATWSTDAPARMRAWISRGRNWLSNSIEIWPSRVRSPRAAARNCSSAGTVNRSWRAASSSTTESSPPPSVIPTTRSARIRGLPPSSHSPSG